MYEKTSFYPNEFQYKFTIKIKEKMALYLDNLSYAPVIPVSWGELIDKICILEIKKEKAVSEASKNNIVKELELLNKCISKDIKSNAQIIAWRLELKEINLNIWNVEDEIRAKEAAGDYRERFIELARNTYIFNDKRATVKRKINEILNSTIVEEKIY